jgi:hypothetical protein
MVRPLNKNEYLITSVEDQLSDLAFTWHETERVKPTFDYYECNVCESMGEEPHEVPHEPECFVGKIAQILHEAWQAEDKAWKRRLDKWKST